MRRSPKESFLSQFTETMFKNAQWSMKGMVTGEPGQPVRHTWAEVHARAARIAGGLAAGGVADPAALVRLHLPGRAG